MRRRLVCRTIIVAALAAACGAWTARAASESHPPILQRFLAVDQTALSDYRALRHLEARNDRLGARAWMDVWTDADAAGFRYTVVGQGGSGYIRSRVFEQALETETDLWRVGPARGSFTADNYEFGDCAESRQGDTELAIDPVLASAACVGLKPRRKDIVLVDGSIFLHPDGDLVGVHGSLAKAPSFWARRVDIVRRYARIAGVRVPVAFESVASLRLAGRSTMTMTYQYERVNGRMVAAEQALAAIPSLESLNR